VCCIQDQETALTTVVEEEMGREKRINNSKPENLENFKPETSKKRDVLNVLQSVIQISVYMMEHSQSILDPRDY
jgi:hypothetical protein